MLRFVLFVCVYSLHTILEFTIHWPEKLLRLSVMALYFNIKYTGVGQRTRLMSCHTYWYYLSVQHADITFSAIKDKFYIIYFYSIHTYNIRF